MATVQVSDRWEAKIFVDFALAGFSESYHFPDAAYATFKNTAKRLVNARADLLALGFSIPHVSLSKGAVNGDSYRSIHDRTGPINLATETLITDIAPCNDAEVGPLWRFDTGVGKFVNRCIRGLRDTQITNNAATYQSSSTDNQATCDAYAGAVAATTTHNAAMKTFLSMIFNYTRHYSKLGATLAGSWDETPFASIQYRRIGSHDSGQRYRSTAGRQRAWA